MQRPESVDLGPEHGDALKAALWSLLECDSLTDVTLVAADAEGGGGRVRAHRVVLAAASKYFRVKLHGISKTAVKTSLLLQQLLSLLLLRRLLLLVCYHLPLIRKRMVAPRPKL